MEAVHRPATLADAQRLFEIRRTSILELAPSGMSPEAAELWANSLSLVGMKRKLRDLEIWVTELNGTTAGWGAIRGDYLEGLYTAPDFAGRGVGAGLLAMLEELTRGRGGVAVRAEAGSNALNFYLRGGDLASGPQTPEGAWPIVKQLE